MSGEKCGKIKVADRRSLLESWRAAQAEERRRWAAEERRQRAAKTEERRRRAAEEKRQRAAERKRQRAEAEKARAREREEREREMLMQARKRLQELEDDLNVLRDRASAMRQRFGDISLPSEPELPDVDCNDTVAILGNLPDIEHVIAAYRNALNASMLAAGGRRAAAEGRDEILEWYGSFVAKQFGTPAIGFAGNEEVAGREAQTDELRRRAFERARMLMGEVEGRVIQVPEDLGRALEAVLDAASTAELREAEEGLKGKVQQVLQRVKMEEKAREKVRARLETDQVAALMAQALREMDYVVSEIHEAAYAENGQIFASRPGQSGHAVRLTINSEEQRVTSRIVRIEPGETTPLSREEQAVRVEADRQADEEWCSPEGVVRFEETLGARGVTVEFSPAGKSGVDTVSVEDVTRASPSLAEHLQPQAAKRHRRPAGIRAERARTRSAT